MALIVKYPQHVHTFTFTRFSVSEKWR